LKFVADKTEVQHAVMCCNVLNCAATCCPFLQSLFLCTCKATNNAPRCDGSHKAAEEVRSLIKAHDIVIFSMATCPYCETAKEALTEAEKPFHSHPVTEQQLAALAALTGQESVPNIWVKGTFVGGCNDGPEGWMGITRLIRNGGLDKLLRQSAQ
jgi:glutaredoxin 3